MTADRRFSPPRSIEARPETQKLPLADRVPGRRRHLAVAIFRQMQGKFARASLPSQVPSFRIEACDEIMPPIHRLPRGP